MEVRNVILNESVISLGENKLISHGGKTAKMIITTNAAIQTAR